MDRAVSVGPIEHIGLAVDAHVGLELAVPKQWLGLPWALDAGAAEPCGDGLRMAAGLEAGAWPTWRTIRAA